jgi:protein-tyrosine sulfotransferase
MRYENGNGHGDLNGLGGAWSGGPADGGLGADGHLPGSFSGFPAGNGIRRISLSDHTQPPVFVLSVARSGSTLLRFILDSHPELACPPETNVGQVCFGLARLWDLLEPSPESARDGWRPNLDPGGIPDEAALAIRAAVDGVYGRYLARHGKSRWCDKSLDSARLADLLARVYPGAQFICLYRHAMDVVVSAIEAAPWGLSGYGFDSYVAGTPGNMVLAAARCWLDQTRAIIEFQDKNPDRCHGVRYEDLVTGPEQVAADLFTFLNLAPAPGITQTCLSKDHDNRGPADHKIWFTSQISTASLGQGARVPVQMLPPELLKNLNETLDQLVYRQVDEGWKAAPGPLDPRADAVPGAASAEPADATQDAAMEAVAGEIASRLGSAREDQIRNAARRWPDAVGRTLVIAVQPSQGSGQGRRMRISCADSALTISQEATTGSQEATTGSQGETGGEAAITLLASPGTWQALLEGRANVAAEMRAGRLLLGDTSGGPHAIEATTLRAEMHMIAHLLGLGAGNQASSEHQQADPVLASGRRG